MYMKEQEIEGRVQVTKITKVLEEKDKNGKLKYNKGYIVNGKVHPLIFLGDEEMKVDINQTTLPIPSISTLKKIDLRDCDSDSDSDSDYE